MYATVEDIIRTTPAIGSLTSVHSSALAAFIEDADAVINTRVAQAYTLPLSGTYPILKMCSANIATYFLLSRRIMSEDQATKSVGVGRRYKDATDILDKIASGEYPLVSTSGDVLTPSTDGGGMITSTTSGRVQTFAELPEEYLRVDPNKQDALLTEREWWDRG